MSSLKEDLERVEMTAHISSKHVGLTIALIGVLITFCAAMVTSEQNELTRTMTEQTQAHSDYSGASTKFRGVMIELEKLRHESSLGSTEAGPLPELKRFLRLSLDYSREREFAKTWVDMYQPAVEAHFNAAEGYHNAQLVAEIGLVVASLAIMLSSRAAWGVWAAFQPWIVKVEQFGLLTHAAMTESVSLCTRMRADRVSGTGIGDSRPPTARGACFSASIKVLHPE